MQDAVPAGRHAATDRSRRVLVATLLVLAALAWTATIALARSPAAMSVMPAALAAGPCHAASAAGVPDTRRLGAHPRPARLWTWCGHCVPVHTSNRTAASCRQRVAPNWTT
jgi:predicted metal-binding membrane protein